MEVLEFLDDSGKVMIKRVPEEGQLEIKWGSQLTVRESQEAVFFRDGRSLDVFGPGRHVLQTQNIPLIGKWVTSFGYGPTSPFRAEVVFIGKQLFPNLKWGTREPILLRDQEFHMVRLRSYGSFSIQISNSALFVNKVAGTMGLFTTDEISDYLRSIIVSKFNVLLSGMLKTILDIPALFDSINLSMKVQLSDDFEKIGIKLHDFYIQSVSLPDEVQEMIDKRTELNAIGNLDQYMKFKIADSLQDAAKNNSAGGIGLGIGTGIGMGTSIPSIIQQSINPQFTDSVSDKLKKLKELLDIGALTRTEFDLKKSELLRQI